MSDVDASLLDDNNMDFSDNDNDEREGKKEANGEEVEEEEKSLPRYTPHQVIGTGGGVGIEQQPLGSSSHPPEPASVADFVETSIVLTRRHTGEAGDEPHGWWTSREVTRPWRDKPDLKRRPSVPPQQSERWERVKLRVALALRSTMSYGLDATHDLLEISADLVRFAPIPGLEEAARVLLTIWDSLQLVETNRLACLRLTERCADILLSVREEIHEAGDTIGEDLKRPMHKLVESFTGVYVLLQKQVHRPFLKRYLKRDDILRSINACDTALNDALGLFSIRIQIRTLRQLQNTEAKLKADTERILATLSPPANEQDATPRQRTVPLPMEPSSPPLPSYESSTSGPNTNTSSTQMKTDSTSSRSASGSSGQASSNGSYGSSSGVVVSEVAQSPPPTPDSLAAMAPEASQVTIHPPPTAQEIKQQLQAIVDEQNTLDHALDVADLRALMREALAKSSDVEMLRVLQVRREEMPEAIKTLQRALECEREKDKEEQRESVVSVEEVHSAEDLVDVTKAGGRGRTAGGSGVRRLGGLTRRMTTDSATTKASKKSKNKERMSKLSRTSTTKSERDTLDREFIENGIDALRRLSRGQEINLPTWTITKFEVDLEQRIGMGYFSDVYRANWQNAITGQHLVVAVKVLLQSTERKVFVHEMCVWKNLQHPHVHMLLGASSATGEPPWFLVSPYMRNGNLVDYLRGLKKPVEGTVHRRMVYEVAKGMAYLHRQGVIHGDLKGTNVLIDDDIHCVITDFGQSEMKNEAYRLSGDHPPKGTLRWQAPEMIDGSLTGSITYQCDVYAYAIVCVEIFGDGALPWSGVDDESYRILIIDHDKRPPITSLTMTPGIMTIIGACWVRNPSERPTFQKVHRELKKLGMNKYTDSPSLGARVLYDDSSQRRHSPDIRPGNLPEVDNILPEEPLRRASMSVQSSPGPSTTRLGSTLLSPVTIPMQRLITPIREDDKQDSAAVSPVSMKAVSISMPMRGHRDAGIHNHDWGMDDREQRMRMRTMSEGGVGSSGNRGTGGDSTSSSTSRTGSTDVNSEPYVDGPGKFEELERFESPLPADEMIAQRKNESRYRLLLRHSYNFSLILPLWEPSPVELGAVGYLLRPSGQFITLFNAFNPGRSHDSKAQSVPALLNVKVAKQIKDQRKLTQRGLDIIQGLLWFRSRSAGDFQQNVSRRVSFPIRAGQKSAFLYSEITQYRYINDNDLTAPRSWFQNNIDMILDIYGKDHHIQKEDIYFVVGTLDTPDWGLFVNHNNPDGQVHFNVFAGPRMGEKWGAFSVDTDSLPVDMPGPLFREDVRGKHLSANKVSEVQPSRQWDTVLLARLRFRPDDHHPTLN